VAKGYRPVDRDQQFLMPPDMRQWLAPGHPVWVLIDMVRLLDTSELHKRCRTGGAGRAGFDPDMMLTLLFFAYARGIRSSRQIERLCWENVAFRVICAQDVPDHTTIWRFADMSPELVESLFTQVLMLCARAGMGQLETITLDGMKIGANASKSANRSEVHIRAELARISAEAVAEHRAIDAEENALFGLEQRGDEVPEDLADERQRVPRLKRALADLEQERKAAQAERDAKAMEHLQRLREGERLTGAVPRDAEVAAAQLRLAQAIAAQQAKIDEWERRNAEKIAATGKGLTGEPPRPVEEHFAVIRARASLAKALARQAERAKKEQQQQPAVRNTTDPDTRLMPTKNGFIQGLNAQNVVCQDHLIIATDLVHDPADVEQWVPMMDKAQQAADLVTTAQAEQATTDGEACTCPPSSDNDDQPTPAATDSQVTADGDIADGQSTEQDKPRCPLHPTGIGTAVGDAGYLSKANVTAPGPDRLIATGKRRDVEKAARAQATDPTPDTRATDPEHAGEKADPGKSSRTDEADQELDPIEAMAQRLRTPEAMAIYRKRGHIAETPHGHIKHNMGIRALTRRGLRRLRAEWKFIAATYNLGRLQQNLRKTGKTLPATA
jgi:transposase